MALVDAKAKGKIPTFDENWSSSWSVTVMTDWLYLAPVLFCIFERYEPERVKASKRF